MKVQNKTTVARSALVVVMSIFAVTMVVGAATTIDNNILTGGTLDVTGLTTLGAATSTSATTTTYLWVGASFSVPSSFDYDEDLAVSGDLLVASKTTSTVALWVGSTGDAENLNLAGGDLYVENDAEIDGTLYLGNNESIGNSVNGLIELGGSASTTGDLYVSGGTFDLTTSTATTSAGLFVRDNTTATTTLGVGNVSVAGDTVVGCLELVASDGLYYFCYVNDSGDGISCAPGSCKDTP